jgi:enterochelin esterase-like enzyme
MSLYQNIELSDPQYESGGLRQLTFRSEKLGGRGDVTLFVPPGCENSTGLPAVLLLHGVYNSHWAWSMQGGAHIVALRLMESGEIDPVVLVMPSDGLWGDGTAYLPLASGNYEQWVMEDVVGCCREVVPCLEPDSPLFIAGQSMGGYGALRLGAKYAEQVTAISAHSPVTDLSQLLSYVKEPLSAYGKAAVSHEALPLYWLEKNREILPPFRFDCGTGDELIAANRELHRSLYEKEISHIYEEFDGCHDWNYWREHISDTFRFFNSCMTSTLTSSLK